MLIRLLVFLILAAVVAILLVRYVVPDALYWWERLLRRWGYVPRQKAEAKEPVAVLEARPQLEALRVSGRITPGQLERLLELPAEEQSEQVEVVLYANELWQSLGFLSARRREEAIAEFARLTTDGSLPDAESLGPPLWGMARTALRQEHTPGSLRATVRELVLVAAEVTNRQAR